MSGLIFDSALLPLRLQRARRMNADPPLLRRAFDDCLDRIAAVRRPFRSALIYGRSEPDWPGRLAKIGVERIAVVEPGSDDPLPTSPDLCLTLGALDTAEPLRAVLAALRATLAPDAFLIGAIVGGESFPALRAAMRAADGERCSAAHVHPRISASGMANLLADVGFLIPVVDVDRISLLYRRFDDLIRDLRGMAATNRLINRPRKPIVRRGMSAARASFSAAGNEGRTTEIVELIHFAAWNPNAKSL